MLISDWPYVLYDCINISQTVEYTNIHIRHISLSCSRQHDSSKRVARYHLSRWRGGREQSSAKWRQADELGAASFRCLSKNLVQYFQVWQRLERLEVCSMHTQATQDYTLATFTGVGGILQWFNHLNLMHKPIAAIFLITAHLIESEITEHTEYVNLHEYGIAWTHTQQL